MKRIKTTSDILGEWWDRDYTCLERMVPFDKKSRIQTDLHYTDPTARQERTVFGRRKEGLFYSYDDRLYGDKWIEGAEIAKKQGIEPRTAEYYETILKHFHDAETLDLQHIILGCNMSNGYSYLVFGYTYKERE